MSFSTLFFSKTSHTTARSIYIVVFNWSTVNDNTSTMRLPIIYHGLIDLQLLFRGVTVNLPLRCNRPTTKKTTLKQQYGFMQVMLKKWYFPLTPS